MKLSAEGLAFIHRKESLKLRIYTDFAGKATIGWGHCLSDAEKATGVFANGITREEADHLLQRDIAYVESEIDRLVRVPLNDNQRAAVTSLCFNCGTDPLYKTFGKVLNAGNYAQAAEEFRVWNKYKHPKTKLMTVSPTLTARRLEEAALFVRDDVAMTCGLPENDTDPPGAA